MLSAIRANQAFSMGPNGIITSIEFGMKKPNGMILGLPNLRKIKNADGNGESWAYDKLMGRSLIPEYIHPAKTFQRCIQSLARDIIGHQMVLVAKKYPIVLTVHDEICILAKDEEVDEAVKYMQECMTSAPEWCLDLPLACEVGVGDNYGDAK
jgi:DNA polymerase